MAPKILVASFQHNLLPLAWRLKRSGLEVEALVSRKRYSHAWSGRIFKASVGSNHGPEDWEKLGWIDQVRDGAVLLTDDHNALGAFAHAPLWYPTLDAPTQGEPALVLGAWYTGSEWVLPHWLIPDWGAWVGGQGPRVMGGATLVWSPSGNYPLEFLAELEEPLQRVNYRGLVGVGLRYFEMSQELQPLGFWAGWEPVHWHLFVSSMENVETLLTNPDELHENPRESYHVGVVVSQPPWPKGHTPKPPAVVLEGIDNETSKQVFWHDIMLHEGKAQTAQVDGLVGVARGAGRTFQRARMEAMRVAGSIRIPEKQVRVDVGSTVDGTILGLELVGLW